MVSLLRNIAETTSRMAPTIATNIKAPANVLKQEVKTALRENAPIIRNVAEGLVDPIAMSNLAKTGATSAMCAQCRRLNCPSMGGKSKKASNKKKSKRYRRHNKGKKTRKH